MEKLIVLALVLSTSSCSWFNHNTTPNTPGVVSCTVQKVKDEALSILGKVATALSTGGYEAALATLITTLPQDIAEAAVACAVQQVANDARTASMASPGDALSATREQNGRAWLATHNIQFAK